MRTLSSVVAIGSLLVTGVLLAVPGGVLLAAFSFGLFLLGLVGVFSETEDRTVRQRDPAMDPRRWRDGS